MKLLSTTLTGNNAAQIGGALESAIGWVDACLVIDTGVTDDTLDIAKRIAGCKLVVRSFPWVGDFSAARNFALDAAAELGADWCMTLDTDERMALHGADVYSVLAQTSARVLRVADEAGTYEKERFFKLPMEVRFTGPTHESFPAYKAGVATLERVSFSELPKTVEQSRTKFDRDATILAAYTQEHPQDPRWFYYLGESLKSLGRNEEAIAAYERCASLRGWNEESAWACYRTAEILVAIGRFEDAIDRCALGLARHAGIPELAWLAAFASWQAGRADQASYWARMAIPMGMFKGEGGKVHRIGFRHPPGQWEGPYDVLRFALKALGDGNGAEEAEGMYQQAEKARKGVT